MTSKHYGSGLLALLSILATALLLAPGASAAEPAEGYGDFAGCPDEAGILLCMHATVDGGHFQMGSKDVPISKPITVSGGVNGSFEFVANSKGGMTPVKQQVPGGVIGLTGLDWLVNFLNIEALKLYAVTELAGHPGNPLLDPLSLPIKVHLINPVLGNNCYVGSVSNPIALNLTYGTTNPPAPNEPISGHEPTLEPTSRSEVFRAENGVWVDNSFAAPGASGCTLTLFGFIPVSINGLVNSQSGLPSAAGRNETVQNHDIEVANPAVVYP